MVFVSEHTSSVSHSSPAHGSKVMRSDRRISVLRNVTLNKESFKNTYVVLLKGI